MICSNFRLPVFADLVFEDSRSPIIAAITALRVLVFFYSLGLFASVGLYSPGLTCPEAIDNPKPEADVAGAIFFVIFTLFAALSSSRAQSRRFLLPALISGLVYLGLLSGIDLPACDAVVKSGEAFGSAIASAAISAVDTTFSIITLICLALLIIEDPPASIGFTSKVVESRESRIGAAVEAIRTEFKSSTSMPISLSLIKRTMRGVYIAPLRHHLATVLASTFVISFAALAGSASTLVRKYEPVIADMIYPFIAQALADAVTSVFVGALFACLSALIAVIASYAPIYDDLSAYAAATLLNKTQDESKPLPLNDSIGVQVSESPLATPLVDTNQTQQGVVAQSSLGPFEAVIAYLTRGLGAPMKNNALDLTGDFFSYYKASAYTTLFVMNLLTLFGLTTGIFSFVIFIMTSRITFGLAIQLVGTFISSWLYQRTAAWFYGKYVAKGTQIIRPRLFVLCDFIFACSLGAAQGFTSAITRFILGLLFMLVQMTNISRPLVPMQFAGLDGGFVAYGSMLKAALAPFPVEIESEAAATSVSTSTDGSQETKINTINNSTSLTGVQAVSHVTGQPQGPQPM